MLGRHPRIDEPHGDDLERFLALLDDLRDYFVWVVEESRRLRAEATRPDEAPIGSIKKSPSVTGFLAPGDWRIDSPFRSH